MEAGYEVEAATNGKEAPNREEASKGAEAPNGEKAVNEFMQNQRSLL